MLFVTVIAVLFGPLVGMLLLFVTNTSFNHHSAPRFRTPRS
jgi:hypothetical protein